MNEIQKRKAFQRVKSMTTERFWSWMNYVHNAAYQKAVEHYTTAGEIVLTPKQQRALHEKAKEICETWDGMSEITLDETEVAENAKVFGRESNGAKDG